jgi:hypothetical protein
MADVLTRDGDVTFKDEDVTFDHELLTLTVSNAYSACTVGTVLLEYAFLVSHGIQTNVVAAVALVQEHNPTASNTSHSNLPQSITINIVSADEPDPVWFDTTAAVFKDHGDGVFYPHYLTILELSDCVQPSATGSSLLFVESVLTVATVYDKQVADAITLQVEIAAIAVNSAVNINVADTVSLSQEYQLSLSNAFDSQVAEAVALGVEYVITLSYCDQQNVVETIAFFVEGVYDIALSSAINAQYSEAIDLSQTYVLTVSSSSVVSSVDPVVFVSEGTLVVQNAYSGQTADAVTVSEYHALVVLNTIDVQFTDAVVLEQTYYLTTDDTYHEQLAESPLLNEESEDVLTVGNIAHSQFVDALALIQSHVANSLDCAQLQYSDTLDLLISHVLAVANCENKCLGQTVTLGFKSGFLGVIVDPYLLSITQHRAMVSTTPQRYLMQ